MVRKSTSWFIRAVFVLGILLTPFSAAGQASNAVPISGGPVVTQFNTPAVNAPVRVCPVTAIGNPCDTTGVTLYSDYNLTQLINNPTATNAQGVYNAFTTAGFYLIQISPTPTTTYSYYYFEPVPGVVSINGVGGQFTFQGAGVSCSSTTCNFSGDTGSGTVQPASEYSLAYYNQTGSSPTVGGLAPSSTVGLPLVSQGLSAVPVFADLTIPVGGTGATTAAGAAANIVGGQNIAPSSVITPYVATLSCGGVDDHIAIAAAVAAVTLNGGELDFPPNLCVTNQQISLAGVTKVTLKGKGSKENLISELRYTGTAAPFIDLTASYGVLIDGLGITYDNAGFTGSLIEGNEAQSLTLTNDFLEGEYYNNAASLLDVPNSVALKIDNVFFQSAAIGITGPPPSSIYSYIAGITNTAFNAMTSCDVKDAGTNWTFSMDAFEALVNGNACAITSTTGNTQYGLVVEKNWFGDAAPSGASGSWLTLHPSGAVISGNGVVLVPGSSFYTNGENGSNGVVFQGNQINYNPSIYTNEKLIDFGTTTGNSQFIVQGNSGTFSATQIVGTIPSDFWFCNSSGCNLGTKTFGTSTRLQVNGRSLFTGGVADPGADGSPAGVAIGFDGTRGFIQGVWGGTNTYTLALNPDNGDVLVNTDTDCGFSLCVNGNIKAEMGTVYLGAASTRPYVDYGGEPNSWAFGDDNGYDFSVNTSGIASANGYTIVGGASVLDRCSGGTLSGAYVGAGSTQATACTSGGGSLVNTGIITP